MTGVEVIPEIPIVTSIFGVFTLAFAVSVTISHGLHRPYRPYGPPVHSGAR